jgi:hypothetical protein
MQTEYSFSDRERLYFERLQQQFNQSVISGIQMIVTQQSFEGQWRIKQDGSGIERADVPKAQPGESLQLPDLEALEREIRNVNGSR